MVTHEGSLTSGHYIAFVKARSGLRELARLRALAAGEAPSLAEREAAADFLGRAAAVPGGPGTDDEGVGVAAHWVPSYSWYKLDDQRVRPVSAAHVQGQQAYLLFYARRDAAAAMDREDMRRAKASLARGGREA